MAKIINHTFIVLLAFTTIVGIPQSVYASEKTLEQDGVSMNKTDYGKTPSGEKVDLYTLENDFGLKVGIITYGGIIVSIEVPDKDGKIEDIALGFDSLEFYLDQHPYFGSIVGRYANRIAKGKFTLDGEEYILAQNNGANALHGGIEGYDKKVWKAEEIRKENHPALKLTYTSEDGEEGYPGTVVNTVIYSINNDNELKIEYYAETDKATPINLTNHTYFNLAGHQNAQEITDHIAFLNADHYTPVDDTLIPTGKIESVEGTPFDFTSPKKIGERINADHEQIEKGGGYDHNFVLNKKKEGLTFGGRVVEPQSGRMLEFYTTQPGVQFYTGNFLDSSLKGKKDVVYNHRFGFCLETQHFPDSPNQSDFPSVILKPGDQYNQTTIYKFLPKKF